MKSQNSAQALSLRFNYVLYSSIIFFFIIISYLLYLQVYESHYFLSQSSKNFTRCNIIYPVRGTITDQSGKKIATNKAFYSIAWQGTGNKRLSSRQISLIEDLNSFINLGNNNLDNSLDNNLEKLKIKILQTERQFKQVILAKDLPIDSIKLLLEKYPSEPNLNIIKGFKRLYPYNNIACHVIGYVGNNNLSCIFGKSGLEKKCENELRGEPGQLINTINSCGKLLSSKVIKKDIAGQTVKTTIDIDLQILAEQVFPADSRGACIIIDPKTGAIETMLSRPSFNPNIFIENLSTQRWHQMQSENCLLNRVCFAAHPPASLFKLVTLTASLEEKLVDPETTWICKGKLKFGGRYNHCGRRSGHGQINTQLAFAYSCNIPFYELAQKIKIDTLAKYANLLGLGSSTDFILGDISGLVPTSHWKREHFGEPWWPGESLSAAIGQSYLLTTPIQLSRMIGAFCTGYMVKPRILDSEEIVIKKLDISQDTRRFIKESMAKVAQEGTARVLRRLNNFKIYAKTGTAQTSGRDTSKLNRTKPHLWFAAYFKYKSEKSKVIVILLEHANSLRAGLLTAYNFFENYAAFIDSKNLF